MDSQMNSRRAKLSNGCSSGTVVVRPIKAKYIFKDSTQKTESQLSGEPKDYLAGKGKGKYSAADIKAWPWIKGLRLTGFTDEMSKFPHLLRWIDRIAVREAVQRGTGDKYTTK